MKLMVAVGENLPAAVRGESDILSHMTKDNALFRFYKEALGIPQSNEYISRMMKQLSHRYPHTNILEIGGGTGKSPPPNTISFEQTSKTRYGRSRKI